LFLENIEETVCLMIETILDKILNLHQNDRKQLYTLLNRYFQKDIIDEKIVLSDADVREYVMDQYKREVSQKKSLAGDKVFNDFLKAVTLRVVDTYWVQHIDAMSELRQAVSLQSYGQINPFREYQEIGFNMFETMVENIQSDVTRFVLKAQVRQNTERVQVAKPIHAISGKEDDTRKRQPVKAAEKVGRNDPCPCGSGKKYKHCHGRN
jgi:preprotein translocase subunit SecA